jgi:hypothetical protein
VPCTYKNVGEVDGNLTGMLGAQGVSTPFDVSADSAPIVYAHHHPVRTDPAVRTLERTAGTLTADDLATGKNAKVVNYEADPVEQNLLHMITGDPKRTSTVALFGNTDFWLSGGPANCGAASPASTVSPASTACVSEPSGGDAWNHGDVAPEINTTFLGIVGPGIETQGVNNKLWSDHTDIQPTMALLLGLHDDYTPDGRALIEVLAPRALPAAVRENYGALVALGDEYSQLNAAVGSFGLNTMTASTKALESSSPGDSSYTRTENALIGLGSERDAVVARMKAELYGAYAGHPLPAAAATPAGPAGVVESGNSVLRQAADLAG